MPYSFKLFWMHCFSSISKIALDDSTSCQLQVSLSIFFLVILSSKIPAKFVGHLFPRPIFSTHLSLHSEFEHG